MKKIEDFWVAKLPEIIVRNRVGILTDGAIAPHTVANHDSMGTGPSGKFIMNGKVCYHREDFVAWLVGRTHTPHQRQMSQAAKEGYNVSTR